MNRRHFLLAGVIAAGCRETPQSASVTPAAGPSLSDDDRTRIAAEAEARRKHIAMLESYRIGLTEERKTPAPPINVVQDISELKTQYKPAIRLHPRFGDEPAPDATKIGGQFMVPATAPWPVCPISKVPMVAVLQLRELDKPPQFQFHPGSDLMQLYWSPRDPAGGELPAVIQWQRRNDVLNIGRLEQKPNELAYPSLTPVACRVMTEWVTELPDWETLMRTELKGKLVNWKPAVESKLSAKDYYNRFLTSSSGCKVGGWPRSALTAPACKKCQNAMDYLLTIDTSEWTPLNAERWRPVQDSDDAIGRRAAIGIGLSGGTAAEIHICKRCDGWPVRAMVVS